MGINTVVYSKTRHGLGESILSRTLNNPHTQAVLAKFGLKVADYNLRKKMSQGENYVDSPGPKVPPGIVITELRHFKRHNRS